MSDDLGTLSVATVAQAASAQIRVVDVAVLRVPQKLAITYQLGTDPQLRRTSVAVPAGPMAAINTAIANAIQADLPGNPTVNLP